MDCPVYIFTNGRSTFQYAYKSLQACEGVEDIVIVRNQGLAQALNNCLENGASYFFKVDDDFFLHPKAILYMRHQLQGLPKTGWSVYCCVLWDVQQQRKVGNMKVYNVAVVRQIGGFKGDQYGRVDGILRKRTEAAGFSIYKEVESYVGLHVCGLPEDQRLHRKLWGRDTKTSVEDAAKFYLTHNMENIYESRIDRLNELNKQYNSLFHRWMGAQ